uniref:Cleavage and polyadenylation specificity factor subunit 6 n=1 Tax=Timema monikensis TaxID=170555 RepID=A0A7R9HJX9_9NEOP|nr:unnamed protein product [Timema monikensis]
MADGVDIDLYADDIEQDFAQGVIKDEFAGDGIDLYDDVIAAPPGGGGDENSQGHVSGAPMANQDGHSPGGANPPYHHIGNNIQPNQLGRRHQLYVGNLTWWTTDQDITEAVISIGVTDFLEVKFFENRANGQSKGFCVITLGSDASMRMCLERLIKKELHGQLPIVTFTTKQALMQFEANSKTRPAPPPNPGPRNPHPHPHGPPRMMMGPPQGMRPRMPPPGMPPPGPGQRMPGPPMHQGPPGHPGHPGSGPPPQGHPPPGFQHNSWNGPRANGPPRSGPPPQGPHPQGPPQTRGPPPGMAPHLAKDLLEALLLALCHLILEGPHLRPDWNRPPGPGGMTHHHPGPGFQPPPMQGPPPGQQGPPRGPPPPGQMGDDDNVPDLSNPAVHNMSDSDENGMEDEDYREILSPEQPLPLPFPFQEPTS